MSGISVATLREGEVIHVGGVGFSIEGGTPLVYRWRDDGDEIVEINILGEWIEFPSIALDFDLPDGPTQTIVGPYETRTPSRSRHADADDAEARHWKNCATHEERHSDNGSDY